MEGVRVDRRDPRRQEPPSRVDVLRRAGPGRREPLPGARQEPGQDDAGARLSEEPHDAVQVDRRAGTRRAEEARPEPQEGPRPHRGENPGRRRAGGEDRPCRGDRRKARRVEDGALRVAKGDHGR